MRKESLEVRLLKLFVVAALLLVGGFILSGILPENKTHMESELCADYLRNGSSFACSYIIFH